MAKETRLFSVQTEMNDRDYEDVYRIYLQQERGSEKKIALITCIILAVIFLILMAVFRNITFIFYAIGCIIIGILYCMVPVNRKFVAQNKLQFGEKRETGFYPHQLSTFELIDDEEELTEEEREEATTVISTGNVTAYENARGFLFADGRISNQFLYLPKRQLDAEEIEKIREYAEKRCSGGYHLLEMRSLLTDGADSAEEETDDSSFVSEVCDQYYGAKKLRLYDEDGQRVRPEEEDALPDGEELPEDAHTARMDAPEMDIDAELEKILSEDEDG